jgi:sec-independent protein translocase protein TatB
MDFLGIGPLELIVVLIIAFIVVGPERLPELARSIGKQLRELRALSQGLTAEWQREIDSLSRTESGESLQETLTKPFKEVQADLQQALPKPIDVGKEIEDTLTKPLKEAQTDLEQAPNSSPASSSDAKPKPTPTESTPSEQSETASGDAKSEPAPTETTPSEQSETASGDANHVDD